VTEIPARTAAPYELGGFWDEMFQPDGRPRPQYAALAAKLLTLSPGEVDQRQRAAELSFEARGITFALKAGPDGLDKIIPFDLVPRVITREEWTYIERGLEQRVRRSTSSCTTSITSRRSCAPA